MPSPVSLDKIKDVLRIQAGSSKVDVASSTRTLYVLLIELLKELRSSVPDGYNFSDFTALVEDIWQSKKVAFSVNVASMLAAVLKEGLHKIPGFVVRSLVTAAANCCNNKTSTPLARENALTFMTILIRDRISDCASQSMDVFQIASKLIKATEVGVRIQSVKTLQAIVLAGGGKLSDMYVEVMKVIQRAVLDKAETVRDLCIHTVRYLTEYSDGFSIVGADVLLSILAKPLEDESAIVQASAAMAAATVYELQIRAFVDKLEQAKIGAARGSDNATKAKQPATTSRLSIAKFTSKKVVEEQHDLKTVVDNLIRIFYRSNDTLRSGYLLTLGFLLEYYLDSIDGEDLDWAVLTIMTIPQEPNFQQLSFEEQTSWRTKISAVLRRHIFSNLPEQKLISVANALIKSCGGLESGSKSDLEMQIILEETNHVLNNLGAALVALRDEAITCATVNLRHSSFAVRVAAANILVTVSAAVPAVAVDFVRNALNNAKTQASQLASMDFTGEELATDEDSGTMTPSPRRKTAKEMEKLQRMYYFHGHAIVMAMILRNVVRIPDGLNYDEILQALDFGLSMMSNDLYAAPATSKNVLCSIIRAGALIVSSCISVGYEVSRLRLRQILDTCSKIFHLGEADPQVVKAEEMVYEVMCIESAVVCIYNLLQYSTESLALDGTCLITVIDHLEVCFRNLKNKYQPVYRAHFRFRTLHVILLESFALLPPGSYPNSCQQIYVEALRVYRDCISSGVECTSPLLDHLVKEGPRNTDIQLLWKDRIWSEAMVTLKLDTFVTVLQKRETEAFLTLFGQDFQPLFASDTFLYDARHGTTTTATAASSTPAAVASAASREASNTFKSSLIETRCLDTAIKLMAVTFSHQSSEYQDKAIQLFAQAMAQVAPAPAARMSLTGSSKSLSLFGNDEERKRKERRMYLVHKDVVCALYAIVEAFPVHSGEVVELEYQWRESLVDQLYTFLTVKDDTLRFTAAISLAKFSMKWRGYNVISSVSQKIRAAIIPSLAKTASGDTSQFMEDLSGYIPALGYLWSAASTLPDVRSLVTTTLFDCLRKADASIHFLSLVMAALACICDAQLAIGIEQMTTTTETMAAEASDFLEKVVYVIESTQALVSNTDEEDMLVLECVALLGPALALALHCKASSELTMRLQTLLWSLPRERPHSGVKLQLAWYRAIQTVAMYDLDGTCLPLVLHALKATHIADVEEGEDQDRHQRILDTCLESIVGTVVALADHHPAVVVQELTVDVVIALLERVLNRACASSILDQRGVEIRQDTIDLTRSSTYRLLAQQLDGALQRVILAHIDEDVERHVTFWMLYLRSIALGLGKPNQTATRRGSMNGGGGGGGGDGGGGDRDDDGDDGGDDGAGSGAAGASGASGGSAGGMGGAGGAAHGGDDAAREETVSLHSLTSISQLSTVYREHMLKRCPYLPYGRMEVKAAALRLATIIAKTYLPRIPAVSDMARARQIAMQDLQRVRATTPTLPVSQFLRLHMPITLYLNDLVNLGCSSATYTLNDKTVLSFQSSGMQFLAEICRWFAQAQDPDYQSQGDGAIDAIESQLLLQFLSQILGALRVCLSIRHAPSLMQDTSEILQLLLSQGFIRDKVALKRLLKPIGTYVEEAFGGSGGAGAGAGGTVQGAAEAQVIRPVTGGVHESNATHEMLVMLRLLGQFRLLAYGNGNGNGVDAGVRATLATFVTEIGDVFYVIAQALITDAVRMFGIIGLPIQQIKDVHPLRGGLTYSPMVHILSYQRTYMDTALLLAQALTVTDLIGTSTSTSASGNTATVDGLMEAIVLLVDAAMDASELPPAVLVYEDAAWLQTVHGQVAVIIAQLCSQRAVLTHPTRSLSLLTRLSVTGATVDVPLVTRIVVTLLQQQPVQAQPTTAAGMELLQVCWSRVLALTKTVVPVIFEKAATDGEGEDAAAPLVSISTLLQRHWAATTAATTTTVAIDDASIKEIVVCWLVLASKLVASSTATESLVYIARLLALLALEYARQHRLVSTTTATGSGALLETLVKAYGKVISLLASSVAVQGECSFLLGLVWRGYQTMVQPPASSGSNSNNSNSSVSDTTTTMTWEAWLETALMLWSTALSMATSMTEVAVPSELVAMWVSLHRLPMTVQSVSVGVATRLLQYVGSNSGSRGSLMLQQTLVPCLLAVYASEEDSEMRGLQLRFFLMAFTVATTTPAAATATGSESRVALFLRAFVPTLCDSIARHVTDAAYLLLTGRALTHIARVAAEDFKAVVATLSDGNRGTLQLAMRTALLQEQQQQQQLQQQQQQQQQQFGSSGGTAPGGGIKINMDRYRHT